MSRSESNRRLTASKVMKEAHKLYKRRAMFHFSFSLCLRYCWASIRGLCKLYYSRIKGVSFNNINGTSRQDILYALTKYHKEDISLYLVKEPANPFDPNAMKIMVMVSNKGTAQVGYLAKEIAAKISISLDCGKELIVIYETITGGGSFNYGMNFSYTTI